jgi:hypothetical protein
MGSPDAEPLNEKAGLSSPAFLWPGDEKSFNAKGAKTPGPDHTFRGQQQALDSRTSPAGMLAPSLHGRIHSVQRIKGLLLAWHSLRESTLPPWQRHQERKENQGCTHAT